MQSTLKVLAQLACDTTHKSQEKFTITPTTLFSITDDADLVHCLLSQGGGIFCPFRSVKSLLYQLIGHVISIILIRDRQNGK